MLDQLLPAGVFAYALVFLRIGSTFMLLPGFGEAFVAPRLRLALALAITFLVAPVVAGALPPAPATVWELLLLGGGEIAVGLFIGTVARVVLAALQTAGTIIALETGLASALVNDPSTQQQSAITGNFLFVFGVLLIFVSDLHHLMLRGLADSYALMRPGVLLPGDMAETVARTVASSFALAMQMAAPFLLVGLVVNLGLGLLARLMPQIQIFFVALPLQVLLGLATLSLGAAGGLLWFLDRFRATTSDFLLPG